MKRKAMATFVAAVALAACSGSETAPSGGGTGGTGGGGTGGGGTPTPITTITITSSGVSPKSISVARGTQVTFVNNDAVPHEMNSDPHPSHGTCPEINNVGFLSAGQSKQTGNLNSPGTCGYHDHNRDTDTSLQGTITIQ